jgi:hypothetical protein
MLVSVNLAAVLFMTGVEWLVQLVAYPLFASVGRGDFSAFHADWSRRITLVVVLPMSVDLVTSLWIALAPPDGADPALAIIGAALAAVTWLSTALLQVPRHTLLSAGFDAGVHTSLVRTSWVRTLAWSAHAVICFLMI